MAFSSIQLKRLIARLKPAHVRSRVADGQILSYLEGWHVVAEANRIFGFDGWDRETVASTSVFSKQLGDRYSAAYTAKVRITVRAGEHTIVREGFGAGEANVASPGQAHEMAAKSAETDATKRALMTFGNAFGLSLYAGVGGIADAKAKVTHTALIKERELRSETDALVPITPEAKSHDGSAKAPLLSPAIKPTAPVDHREINIGTMPSGDPATPSPGIDKSALTLSEPRRIRDTDHLRFVASQPCSICARLPTEAHHLRFAQPRAMGRKVSDAFTVPLCALHHRELHARGDEVAWWADRKLEPLAIADQLWAIGQRRQSNRPNGSQWRTAIANT